MAAKMLRDEYFGNFVIYCGIHLDNIERKEIWAVMDLCKEMIVELCGKQNVLARGREDGNCSWSNWCNRNYLCSEIA
ncbi:prenylated flavin chaperone LpdD [Clostridium thailandense]|uniref:prenylated flavin chaperone LpdD n=1 Tax=Clostridium thailandense TaxID=2794346 RepID=UPI0035E46296